jgi:hypothetical protein
LSANKKRKWIGDFRFWIRNQPSLNTKANYPKRSKAILIINALFIGFGILGYFRSKSLAEKCNNSGKDWDYYNSTCTELKNKIVAPSDTLKTWDDCIYLKRDSLEIQPYKNCVKINSDVPILSETTYGEIQYDSNGYAWLSTKQFHGILIKKSKGIVLWGISYFDNGIDDFNCGLIRIERNHKTGYADSNGRIVIEPQFDGAWQFKNDLAMVCKGCVLETCEKGDCEHRALTGGDWSVIDKSGTVVKVVEDWRKGYEYMGKRSELAFPKKK